MNRHSHTIRLTFAASFGVLLLVMMVFAGVVKHSPARKSRLVVASTGDFLGAPSETSSHRPLHFKRAMSVKHRTLLRIPHLRAKTAKLCSMVAVSVFETRSTLPAAPDLAAFNAGHRTTGARAPPLA